MNGHAKSSQKPSQGLLNEGPRSVIFTIRNYDLDEGAKLRCKYGRHGVILRFSPCLCLSHLFAIHDSSRSESLVVNTDTPLPLSYPVPLDSQTYSNAEGTLPPQSAQTPSRNMEPCPDLTLSQCDLTRLNAYARVDCCSPTRTRVSKTRAGRYNRDLYLLRSQLVGRRHPDCAVAAGCHISEPSISHQYLR